MPLINIGGKQKSKTNSSYAPRGSEDKQSLEETPQNSKRQNFLLKNIDSSSKSINSLLFTPIHFPYLPTFGIKHKKTALSLAVLFLILAIFATIFFVYGTIYADKVFRKVKLGVFDVGGKERTEIKNLLQEELNKYAENNIVLVCEESENEDVNGKEWNPTLEELGFIAQIDKTVEKVFKLGREDSVFSRVQNRFLSLFIYQTLKIEYDLKEDILENYLTVIAQEVDTPYKNSTLILEGDQIKITSPEDGYGIQTSRLKKEIRNSLEILENKDIPLPFDDLEPKIKEEDTTEAKDEAEIMIVAPLTLKYTDKVYTTDCNIIFSWITFSEVEIEQIDPTSPSNLLGIDIAELEEQSKWTLEVSLDEGKIREYVEGIAKEINVDRIDKRVTDDDAKTVLRWGRDGKKLNTEQVISEIKNRIAEADSSQREFDLPVEVDKFQEVKVKPASNGIAPLSDGKYIDISLSRQLVTCFLNNEAVFSSACSTGTWRHPTPTGTFRIYSKYRYTRMTGYYGPGNPDNYDLPNVPYCMFFYGGYSLHGTYWHSNFGHRMSHGCVNLPTSAAGWIYGWAPTGTTVIVH